MSRFILRFLHFKVFKISAILVLVVVTFAIVSYFRSVLLLKEERDTRRLSDLHAVVNACYLYAVQGDGSFPPAISRLPTDIGTSGLNLATDVFTDPLNPIPVDPSRGDAAYTGYVLFEEADGRLTASAVGELTDSITITR